MSPPRVCRALGAVAEALLYRHIVIKRIRAPYLSLLQCSLSTKRQPNGAPAGAWTRKITVAALPSHTFDLGAAHHKGLREVILLCPHLESFCVFGRPWDLYKHPTCLPDFQVCARADFGESVQLRRLRDFFSILEHLRLRRLWGHGHEQVILTFPRLRSLSFAPWITTRRIAQWG
jgi:hypothetical protein